MNSLIPRPCKRWSFLETAVYSDPVSLRKSRTLILIHEPWDHRPLSQFFNGTEIPTTVFLHFDTFWPYSNSLPSPWLLLSWVWMVSCWHTSFWWHLPAFSRDTPACTSPLPLSCFPWSFLSSPPLHGTTTKQISSEPQLVPGAVSLWTWSSYRLHNLHEEIGKYGSCLSCRSKHCLPRTEDLYIKRWFNFVRGRPI